jgi:hypothetical protein
MLGYNISVVVVFPALIVSSWSGGFTLFWGFVLLFQFSEMQHLRLAEFFNILIQLLKCPWALSGGVAMKQSSAQCLYGLRDDLIVRYFWGSCLQPEEPSGEIK